MYQAMSHESFQNFQVSFQVARSFHIQVIIGSTVLVTQGERFLQVKTVETVDLPDSVVEIVGLQVSIIVLVYENHYHNQLFLLSTWFFAHMIEGYLDSFLDCSYICFSDLIFFSVSFGA